MITSLGQIIAIRNLSVAGINQVTVQIGMPVTVPSDPNNNYYCPYQILGLGSQKVRYAGGVDAVQALHLTLLKIGTDLYTSTEYKTGLLLWNGGNDLGFPVPKVIADLAP